MSYHEADDTYVLDRLKQRKEQRYQRYKKRPGGEWEMHKPRWRYDCARCKFSWNCGELCSCSVRGNTPPGRMREVEALQAAWSRNRRRRMRMEKIDETVDAYVKNNPGCTPTEIQRAIKKAPGTVQGSLSRLERQGTVKRNRSSGTVKPK